MHTLIFDKRDLALSYNNQCLIVKHPQAATRSLPLKHISKVVCLHSVELTTQLLGQLWERKIPFVTLNNRYSQRSFAITPNQHKQVERRCTQYLWQQTPDKALELAKVFCVHRLKNNLKLIQQPQFTDALKQQQQRMLESEDLNQLRGHEGIAQKHIFAYWREQLPPQLNFTKRQKRPVKDPVNSLLSLTYTLVHQEAIRQCVAHGLDSQLGFFHQAAFNRDSLACDLMEPIRPYCEQWVFEHFIQGTFNLKHFTQPTTTSPCFLGKQGRSLFYQQIDASLKVWQKKLSAYARWLSRQLDKSLVEAGSEELLYA